MKRLFNLPTAPDGRTIGFETGARSTRDVVDDDNDETGGSPVPVVMPVRYDDVVEGRRPRLTLEEMLWIAIETALDSRNPETAGRKLRILADHVGVEAMSLSRIARQSECSPAAIHKLTRITVREFHERCREHSKKTRRARLKKRSSSRIGRDQRNDTNSNSKHLRAGCNA